MKVAGKNANVKIPKSGSHSGTPYTHPYFKQWQIQLFKKGGVRLCEIFNYGDGRIIR